MSLTECCEVFGVTVATEESEADSEESGELLTVLYSRVSTDRQKTTGNLDRQRLRLEEWFNGKYAGEKFVSISEQGSGINCERKGLLRLFDLALAGKLKRVVVEWTDRLSRGSYVLIAKLLEKCGVEVVITQTGDKETTATTPEEEIIHDAMSMIVCAQARSYGKRAQARRKFLASPETKTRIAVLLSNGVSRREIATIVAKEKHRCMSTGKIFTENGTRSIMDQIKREGSLQMPESVTRFIKERCHIERGKKADTRNVWTDFVSFCRKTKLNLVHRHKLMGFLNAIKGISFERINAGHQTLVLGLAIKA